ATYPNALGPGRPSTTDSRIGHDEDTGGEISTPCSTRSTMKVSSSTLQSCEPTRILRAEKGDQQECIGSFSRWLLHEDPRPRRLERAPGPRRDHAGSTARLDGSRGNHRRTRLRGCVHSGHGIRLELDSS